MYAHLHDACNQRGTSTDPVANQPKNQREHRRRDRLCVGWSEITRGDVVSIPGRLRGKEALSALPNGRGGALAEQFGSVTRRFPWSVIASKHCRQWSLSTLAGSWYQAINICSASLRHSSKVIAASCRISASRPALTCNYAYSFSQDFDPGQEPLDLRSSSCRSDLIRAAVCPHWPSRA